MKRKSIENSKKTTFWRQKTFWKKVPLFCNNKNKTANKNKRKKNIPSKNWKPIPFEKKSLWQKNRPIFWKKQLFLETTNNLFGRNNPYQKKLGKNYLKKKVKNKTFLEEKLQKKTMKKLEKLFLIEKETLKKHFGKMLWKRNNSFGKKNNPCGKIMKMTMTHPNEVSTSVNLALRTRTGRSWPQQKESVKLWKACSGRSFGQYLLNDKWFSHSVSQDVASEMANTLDSGYQTFMSFMSTLQLT